MKVISPNQPPKNAISTYITRNPPTDLRIIEIESRNDTRRIPSEIEKFIGADLTSITLMMIKR
jgi:hypothetical protein